ncbi:hypothetical protein EVAR_89710_1 [Eumeta japonica]|uniref:Uncharacterized protein n=1 Tax=Eumeta variegata TaxID=151549 RepID=A0A4C1X0K5_EUMVA|nr:hypothetical protein EVAR_89710_1 [Eumeta japonica]
MMFPVHSIARHPTVFFFTYRTSIDPQQSYLTSSATSLIPFTERAERRTALLILDALTVSRFAAGIAGYYRDAGSAGCARNTT